MKRRQLTGEKGEEGSLEGTLILSFLTGILSVESISCYLPLRHNGRTRGRQLSPTYLWTGLGEFILPPLQHKGWVRACPAS